MQNSAKKSNKIHPETDQIRPAMDQIWNELGEPVLLDAVQFGSRAYRLRNWWTNMVNMDTLRAVTNRIRRPANVLVKDTWIPTTNC